MGSVLNFGEFSVEEFGITVHGCFRVDDGLNSLRNRAGTSTNISSIYKTQKSDSRCTKQRIL